MKKSIILVLALLVITLAPSVSATDASPDMTTRRRSDKAVEIQEIRQNNQEEREQIRTQTQEMRSNVAENHANRLTNRFTFYFNRFTSIITRFQSRLDTLKSEGKDVSTVQTKLNAAKSKLAEARAKGDQAISAFKAIDPAKFSEQKTEALAARDLAMTARKLYLEVHTLLKEALKALKVVTQS